MQPSEEIDMSTFWNSNNESPIAQQPSPDREEERRTRLMLPISTIDWQSTNSTHFLALSGLDFMNNVESLIIQQSVELLEDMSSENRYTIKVPRGETIYYATESSTSCERNFFGSSRAFKMELHDATQQLALTFKRNLACGTCCTCWVHLQLIEVYNGNGQYLGCTEQKAHCTKPYFSVKDKFNNTVYRILGPTKILCCNPEYLNYQIFCDNGSTQVGSIVHQWDAMQVSYNTILQFPNRRLNNDLKASLLGAAFLMEYMYFQRRRQFFKCIC
ncbi:phospholipid scramblase 2-like isoform X2 [Coccinella septempunctata]|uniref:phospholipid scramblase 2-like isoform X2 n=1 Tax=Coccinella septempunctata TaxID=41139 RepID=UPI001D07D7E3|nr:phospholipid scramblase 2-like isoform X2 [Coccinella septempunctata]